jgi:hypothetical protein
MGDFNLCSSYPENITISNRTEWIDPDAGFTEDSHLNTMRYQFRPVHKTVRYDRILIHDPTRKIISFERLGMNPLPDLVDVFPSDHFGLLAILGDEKS